MALAFCFDCEVGVALHILRSGPVLALGEGPSLYSRICLVLGGPLIFETVLKLPKTSSLQCWGTAAAGVPSVDHLLSCLEAIGLLAQRHLPLMLLEPHDAAETSAAADAL